VQVINFTSGINQDGATPKVCIELRKSGVFYSAAGMAGLKCTRWTEQCHELSFYKPEKKSAGPLQDIKDG
jgi:hypothetical protein